MMNDFTIKQNVKPKLDGVGSYVSDRLAEIDSDLHAIAPSLEIPSTPLFGVLPVARIVPQDVHSVLDYTNGVTCAMPAIFCDTLEARIGCAVLGASVISLSLMTDYRLSLANVVPIEVHEVMDYVWGASCIALPFVLGYYKKDLVTTAIHVVTGVATILTALFTDYRAAKGIGHSDIQSLAMMGARVQPNASAHPGKRY